MFCVLGCNGDLVNAARRVPEMAAEYARTGVLVEADFKKGLSMREIIARAAALDAEFGPAAGSAMARYVGKKATALYLGRVAANRDSVDLAA